jgi:hypothetical protein
LCCARSGVGPSTMIATLATGRHARAGCRGDRRERPETEDQCCGGTASIASARRDFVPAFGESVRVQLSP